MEILGSITAESVKTQRVVAATNKSKSRSRNTCNTSKGSGSGSSGSRRKQESEPEKESRSGDLSASGSMDVGRIAEIFNAQYRCNDERRNEELQDMFVSLRSEIRDMHHEMATNLVPKLLRLEVQIDGNSPQMTVIRDEEPSAYQVARSRIGPVQGTRSPSATSAPASLSNAQFDQLADRLLQRLQPSMSPHEPSAPSLTPQEHIGPSRPIQKACVVGEHRFPYGNDDSEPSSESDTDARVRGVGEDSLGNENFGPEGHDNFSTFTRTKDPRRTAYSK